jgi:tight adherence protein B
MLSITLLILFLSVSITVLTTAQVWWGYHSAAQQASLSDAAEKEKGSKNHSRLLRDLRLSERPQVDAWLQRLPMAGHLQFLLTQAGIHWMADQFLLMIILVWVLATTALTLLGLSVWLSGIGALGAAALPILVALRKKQSRIRLLDQQLPDFLDSVARAMQAGNSFSSALSVVSKEAVEPIGSEFRRVFEEIYFGSSVKEGLQSLSMRNTSEDIRYFVIAVLVHLQTGGSLTSLLLGLSSLIRDRQRLRKLGRVLSAEGRLSAWILTILPFGTALLMYTVNPEFVSVLWTHPTGYLLIQITLGLMIIGVLWMRKIIQFRI